MTLFIQLAVLILALGARLGTCNWPFPYSKDSKKVQDPKYHWAVLIAGSKGWGNYRHQADVSHAYHVLIAHGVPPEHIITFMYDDIAYNYRNPYPGKIFNSPKLEDVYEGVSIDYKGINVTRSVFLSVLAGDKDAVKGIGSQKVLEAGPKDRVFLFYDDHGTYGAVGMPDYQYLYANQLAQAIIDRRNAGGFKEMVVYIEACESGSMFLGFEDQLENIYVTTASNAVESSWGTYCPSWSSRDSRIPLDTCLGDLYSVSWMENSDKADLTRESISDQTKYVKDRTSNSGSYQQGSHVMEFGEKDLTSEPVADFLSTWVVGRSFLDEWLSGDDDDDDDMPPTMFHDTVQYDGDNVQQRDIDVLHLFTAYKNAQLSGDSKRIKKAKMEYMKEIEMRSAIDAAMSSTTHHLLTASPMAHVLRAATPDPAAPPSDHHHNINLLVTPSETNHVTQVKSLLMHGVVARPGAMLFSNGAAKPKQIVDDWDCLHGMVDEWQAKCGMFGDYGMKYTKLFANLCNMGVGSHHVLDSASAQGIDCWGDKYIVDQHEHEQGFEVGSVQES